MARVTVQYELLLVCWYASNSSPVMLFVINLGDSCLSDFTLVDLIGDYCNCWAAIIQPKTEFYEFKNGKFLINTAQCRVPPHYRL